jgi:hypothetical protein
MERKLTRTFGYKWQGRTGGRAHEATMVFYPDIEEMSLDITGSVSANTVFTNLTRDAAIAIRDRLNEFIEATSK